jgi:EAL domain-containing protein (putative c-di-GMP-specific phosphodiesterase class I)
LLRPIGSWVLDEACRVASEWPDGDDGAPVQVFVNLSGGQLADPGLADEVAGVLARRSIDPGRLHLEVTEGTLMSGAGGAATVLHDLRDVGVRIAVDDFGTGYSSLSYLTRLPVDLLKVDRSFVFGMGTRPGDREVTAAIVALAHTLGLAAIAEGVETAEQLAALRALGCDDAQGFWFSEALPADGFAARLAG